MTLQVFTPYGNNSVGENAEIGSYGSDSASMIKKQKSIQRLFVTVCLMPQSTPLQLIYRNGITALNFVRKSEN